MEGDDPADAARYGLVSGVRYAGIGPGTGQAPSEFAGNRLVPRMPLNEQIERQISAEDPTSRESLTSKGYCGGRIFWRISRTRGSSFSAEKVGSLLAGKQGNSTSRAS